MGISSPFGEDGGAGAGEPLHAVSAGISRNITETAKSFRIKTSFSLRVGVDIARSGWYNEYINTFAEIVSPGSGGRKHCRPQKEKENYV